MKNKRIIIICITAIILIIIGLLGVTYGYMQSIIEGNETAKKTTATAQILKMEFSDESESLTSNLEGYFLPGATLTKTFSLTNQSTKAMKYSILVDDLINTFTRDDVVYEMYQEDTLIKKDIFPKIKPGYLANNIEIAIGETQNFKLVVTYKQTSENQIEDVGKVISGVINVEEGAGTTLADIIIKNAKEAKTLNDTTRTILVNPEDLATSYTTPAVSISGADEHILSYTDDDYTAITGNPSYYFRGVVVDNYVNFNNMCWRIVRIEGDGSIKLILEDGYAKCNSASYTGNWEMGDGNYGYTASNLADYENTANRTTSMKYHFDNWYQENFNDVTSNHLKSDRICIGDITTKYWYNGDIITETSPDSIKNAGYFYYYSEAQLKGYGRTAVASLICPTNGSRTSEIKILPLTAEEVALAGGKVRTTNPNRYYLNNDFHKNKGYYWWTLSIANFTSNSVRAFNIGPNGEINNGSHISSAGIRFRPAISIKNGTPFNGGTGTIDNPYNIYSE